eukprot:2102121-Pleurochrysis_carterae.AAC.5
MWQPSRALSDSTSEPPKWQAEDTLVSITGQRVKFSPTSSLKSGRFLTGSMPHGVQLLTTSPTAKVFALVSRALRPRIEVYTYPELAQTAVLSSDEASEYTALTFSHDGKWLLCATGGGSLRLIIWLWKTRQILVSAELSFPCTRLSVCPCNSSLICAETSQSLQVWRASSVYEHWDLACVDVNAPDAPMGGAWSAHAWGDVKPSSSDAALAVLFAGIETGAVVAAELSSVGATPLSVATVQSSSELVLAAESGVSGLHADSTHLLVASRDGVIAWYAIGAYGAPLFTLAACGPVRALVPSPNKKTFLVTNTDGATYLVTPKVRTFIL